MSKKLMMNNYSENGLMPVMDGLVCWLDSRDGYEDNRVRDRVGLNDFLLEGDFGNDFFNLKGSHVLYSENTISIQQNFSIQLCIKINEAGSYGTVFCDKNNFNNFKLCNRNNNKIGMYSSSTGGIDNGVPIVYNDKITITVNVIDGIVSIFDNKILSSSSKTLTSIDIIASIGLSKNMASNICNFDFYSLKIYKRALTEEEIQQNYLYEQSIERG